MPNVKLENFGDYFKLPNPNLRSYFGRVVAGQPDEYRTPFYKGKSLQWILGQWEPTLAKIQREWPSLWEFENDLRAKVGPMSIMKPLSERMEDIDSYYRGILSPAEPISEGAIRSTLKEWEQGQGLRIRDQARTVELMKKSTNSGSPYFDKRSLVIGDTIPCEVFLEERDTIQVLPRKVWKGCAVLGWRGQEGGPEPEDVKQRVVWMFPFAVNVQELQVYQPVIETGQRFNLVPAWVGLDAVDRRITALFDTKRPKDLVICTDFTKFDQHFNHACQDAARQVLMRLYRGDKRIEGWLADVFPIKYEIPLAYDYGKIRHGKHGMGSGSGGTNVDETLTHRCLQHEAAERAGKVLNPNSQCLGDDGILSYPGCSAKDVTASYSRHGLEMNLSKQYESATDCTYLRRWHHTEYRVNDVCVGVYSTYRALGRLAEQERWYDSDSWSNKMVALRQLSILENVKWHPLREEFAEFCMKGDKFRLGLDIPGFLANISAEAVKAIDYMPDFLGYTRSLEKSHRREDPTGIGDWWIVNFLKSKA